MRYDVPGTPAPACLLQCCCLKRPSQRQRECKNLHVVAPDPHLSSVPHFRHRGTVACPEYRRVCVCEGAVMRSVLPAASQKSEVVGLLFRPRRDGFLPWRRPSLPGPGPAPSWVGGVERLLQSCSMQRFLPSRSEKSRTKSEGGNGGQSLPHPGTSPLLAGFAPPQTPVFPPSSRSCDSGCHSVSGHNRMAACHP